jgi:hypothetical protein
MRSSNGFFVLTLLAWGLAAAHLPAQDNLDQAASDGSAAPALLFPVDPWYDNLAYFYYTPEEPASNDGPHWKLADSAASALKSTWYGYQLVSTSPKDGHYSATLTRVFPDCDISTYDGLRFAASLNPGLTVKITLQIDDRPPLVETYPSPGKVSQGSPLEPHSFPIQGGKLKKVELEVDSPEAGGPFAIVPLYFQLHRKTENLALAHPIVLAPRPAGLAATHQPLLWGLVISRDQLPGLREEVKQAPKAAILQSLKALVDPYLKDDVAAEFNHATQGNYLRLSAHEDETSDSWSWKTPPNMLMTDAAMIYLVTGDATYAEFARKLILAISQTTYWTNSLVFRFPQPDEPKSFPPFVESTYAMDVALALDWLSDYLSDPEIAQVQQALRTKAVPDINGYLNRHPEPNAFWRTTNQGLIYNGGLFLAAAVQDPADAEAKAWKQTAEENLRGTWSKISLPDGTAHEGMVYMNVSCLYGAPALLAIAHTHGHSFVQEWGAQVAKMFDFVAYCTSTASHDPKMFNFSDSHFGRNLGVPVIFFLARDSRAAAWLLDQAGGVAKNAPATYGIGNIALVSDLNEPTFDSPGLPLKYEFPDSETIFWRTGWKFGDTSFNFLSGPIFTGHHHDDKNSFTLEYGGERLFVDPGMIAYNDARSAYLHFDEYHNTISIGKESQRSDTGPSAKITAYDDRKPGFGYLVSDATAAYPEARQVRRAILFSDSLNCMVCIDEVTLKKPDTIYMNLQTLRPLLPDGPAADGVSAWTWKGDSVTAHLLVAGDTPDLVARQNDFISDSGPLHRTRFLTGHPRDQVRIVSVYAFGPSTEVAKINRDGQGENFRLTRLGQGDIQIAVTPRDASSGPGITIQQAGKVLYTSVSP